MRIKNCDTFPIEGLGEVLVGYEYEQDDISFSSLNDATYPYDITITSVEVVVKGKGVDFLPFLTPKQIDFIEENLSFNVFNH